MNSTEKKLFKLVKKGDLLAIKSLFESNDKKPLHRKSSNYENQIDINCRETKFQMTPLMIAGLKGSMEILLFLIEKGANVHLKDIKGNTALQLACMKQRFHIIDALLNKKANQNDLNLNGWNCLISAVNYFHDDNSMMILLLLQTGARVEQKDNYGLNCIDHSVRKKKINCLRVILNFNPRLTNNCTRALINASIKANFEIVLLLLNYGANPNKLDETNGSSALHEVLRVNDSKEESLRLRLKIIKYLIMFGASSELKNFENKTPTQIALLKSNELVDIYLEAIQNASRESCLQPKFISYPNIETKFPEYPLLKPNVNWTKNDPKFTSGYRLGNNTENVSNLIDGDPHSMCSFPGKTYNWTIFDLKSEHMISKIRLYAWKNKEMPRECFLQVSNNIDGPWSCVQTFICDMIGSSVRYNAGVPIDFGGFHLRSRFWRLVIASNYGGEMTSFHGVEFFGFDCRISKLLSELGLSEYESILIESDLNQIESLINCTYDQFDELPIKNKFDKQKLWDFIVDLQKKVQSIKKLEWFNEPITFGLVGKPLPPFSVIVNSVFLDSLQIISHGGGILNGELCVELEPIQINNESYSIAIFRNIYFSTSGKFIIEAKCSNKPELSISSHLMQIFELNDPEYYKLLNSLPQTSRINPKFGNEKKLFGQLFNNNIESDDEIAIDHQLDYDYGFPDFSSFDNNSKMKINNWLSKSEELYYKDRENDLESMSSSSFALKKSAQQLSKSQNSNYFFKQNTSSKSDANIPSEIEYETQSFTLEFSDETSSLDSFVSESFVKEKNDSYFNEKPKTEAKAFVKAGSSQKVELSKKTSSKSNVNDNFLSNDNHAIDTHVSIKKTNYYRDDVNDAQKNSNIKSSIQPLIQQSLIPTPASHTPPPPPPPPLLEEGLLKFQRTKIETNKDENMNDLDRELKQKIAYLNDKMNVASSKNTSNEEKFSIRAKKALDKYKKLS